MSQSRSSTLAIAVALSALALLSPGQAVADGSDSPQAAFAAVQGAARNGEAAALVVQLAPAVRCELTFQTMDTMDKMIFASDEKGRLHARWHEVAAGHGLAEDLERIERLYAEPEEEAQAFLEGFRARMQEKGCSAFLADALALVDEALEAEDYSASLLGSFPSGAPKIERLAEDRALAHSEGQALRFLREDGRWYYLPQSLFD